MGVRLSEIIATNARALRAARRLRQLDVATAGGISRTQLSVIEGGSHLVTVEEVRALCIGLSCTLPDLLQGAHQEDLKLFGIEQ